MACEFYAPKKNLLLKNFMYIILFASFFIAFTLSRIDCTDFEIDSLNE